MIPVYFENYYKMKSLNLFFLVLIFLACNKTEQEDFPPPTDPPSPPRTSITMDINGLTRDDLAGKGSYNEECFHIGFSQAGTSFVFNMEKLEERTYHFGKGNYNQYTIHLGPTRISSIDMTPENAGFLTITEIDHEQQLIHGIFELFFGDISNGKFENLKISEGAVCFSNEFTMDGVQQIERGGLFNYLQNDTLISLFTGQFGFSLDKREIQQKVNIEDLEKSTIIGFLQKADSSMVVAKEVNGWIENLELNEKVFRMKYDLLFTNESDSLMVRDGHLEVYY